MAYIVMRDEEKGKSLARKVYKAKELLEDICEAVEEMEEEYGSRGSYRDDDDYDERDNYRRGGYRGRGRGRG